MNYITDQTKEQPPTEEEIDSLIKKVLEARGSGPKNARVFISSYISCSWMQSGNYEPIRTVTLNKKINVYMKGSSPEVNKVTQEVLKSLRNLT